MKSVSIGDIQKNISILTKLKEPILVVDKRKNKKTAIIYPINKSLYIRFGINGSIFCFN